MKIDKDQKDISSFNKLQQPQIQLIGTQGRYFLKNKKGEGQEEEQIKKPKRFANPEDGTGIRSRSFTKIEQDEDYEFGKKVLLTDQQNLDVSEQSIINQLLENVEVDERTFLQQQGLIDYDQADLLEIQAENQKKVKDYLDSLNYQQRYHLLNSYSKNQPREQFIQYKDNQEQNIQNIDSISPSKEQISKNNQQLQEYYNELPREGQILLNQLVENLNQKQNEEFKDLEFLLDLSLSWQKLKQTVSDEQLQSIIQSTFESQNWKFENLQKILLQTQNQQKQIDEEADQKLQKLNIKAHQVAKNEVQDHLLNQGQSYLLLNSKLKAAKVTGQQIISNDLKIFENENEMIYQENINKAMILDGTTQGNTIKKLKELINLFRFQTSNKWTLNQVNRFVISYLQIYKQFKISNYYSQNLDIQKKEALKYDLQNLVLISQKVRESIEFQQHESQNILQEQLNEIQNQEFVKNIKILVNQNIEIRQDQKKNLKFVFDVLENCLLQKGFLPFFEKEKQLQDSKQQNSNLQIHQETENEVKYQEYMRKVLYDDLNLKNNSNFWTFLADIAINTAQTNKFIKDQTIHDQILQEIGMQEKYQRSFPLVDRFINLLLSLHDPTYYKKFTHASNNHFKELGITYNLKNKDAAVGYNLIKDPEYMLKYQLVSMAKFHNFYGSIDQYMKEFTKICISTENKTVIKNLQNLLNAEVSILNEQSKETLLKNFKSLPREIDPMLLAQPEFRFSPVSEKIKMIQNYLDLVKEQDRTREAILLLEKSTNDPNTFRQLTSSFDTFKQLLEEIDQDQSNYEILIGKKIGTFEKFKKTSGFIDEKIRQIFLSLYGIDGISFNNLEDVYSPLVSGIGSLQETRSYLLKKGMTVQFADLLAAKYIRKLEDSKNQKICTIMDFFDTKRDEFQAIKVLADANIKNVFLNYTTLNAYSRLINNTEMIKAMNSAFKVPQSTKFAISKNPKIQPIRPISPYFTQNQIPQKNSQIFGGGSLRAFSDSQGGRGKFFDFLKIAEQVDEQIKTQKDQKKEGEVPPQETEYSFQNIDVSFQNNPQNRLESILNSEQMKELDNQDQIAIFENKDMKEQNERQQLIKNAIQKYDLNFFMQFAFTGKDFLKFSQKNLEEFIVKLENQDDVNLLLLSMINQSYELNHLIPNIELLIFKIFCSPISTQEIRKTQEDQNILVGNIFAQKKMKLDKDVYFSLLHTLKMKQKKKHFKKIVAYIRKFTDPKDLSPEIIDQIISIGIDMHIPVTLGQLVRDMIIQDDCQIKKSTFMKFLTFMEKSKGFEEDAKKFLTLVTQESSSIQIDYEMCRPIILRMMKYKGAPEVIKFFEQLRKNIKLNKANSLLPQIEKNQLIKEIRKGFFIGLMKDLMENKTYQLAEIVMTELQKEKFETTLEDELIAIKIYAAQKKIVDYKQKFNLFFEEKSEGGLDLMQNVTSELSKTLMEFQTDEFKNDRLMMAEKLNRKMQQNLLIYEGEVLHNIIFIYAESQQWNEVANVLKAQQNPKLCFPLPKTLNYLKQNLVYIFQTTQRQALQDALDKFEQTFFSFKMRQERASQKQKSTSEQQEKTNMDDIISEDIKEKGDKDKKMMRRQARQQQKPKEENEEKSEKQEQQNEKDAKQKL